MACSDVARVGQALKVSRDKGGYSPAPLSGVLFLARADITCSLAHREKKKGSEAAGLNMHGQGPDPDSIAGFDLYETFEIEFESSPSKSRLHGSYYVPPMNSPGVLTNHAWLGQDNFVRKWHEVLKARRLQRKALEKINEEIRHATFSAKTAREIW